MAKLIMNRKINQFNNGVEFIELHNLFEILLK